MQYDFSKAISMTDDGKGVSVRTNFNNPINKNIVSKGGGPAKIIAKEKSTTNSNDVEIPNLSELAGGKNGSLEIQKYLYETGLQNVFNDYNKQIASLDASKQKEIEDAYYVRELSKKYLGEYASNQGIGDVSGNLLDIYGSYQGNLNQINQYYKELETGLESSYNEKRNEYNMGLLQTQFDIEQANQQEELEKLLGEISYNLTTGILPDGMNTMDYLDSFRDKIGETNYWQMVTKQKLVDMNQTMTNSLAKTNEYKTQQEWDTHVDSLFNSQSINKEQANYMKGMYSVEQNTNFSRVTMKNDITYYNPDNRNIIKDGKVFESRSGEYVLAQTSTTIDSSSGLYSELDEKGKDIAFDTPFAHNGKWFVKDTKDNEQVYVEYVKSTDYKNLKYSSGSVSSSDPNQKELYDYIHKELNGKNGYVTTDNGMIAYKYENGEYIPYINFQASGVGGEKGKLNIGGEKGKFNIGGVNYTIAKNYKDNDKNGMYDVIDNFSNGKWKNSTKAKPIIQEMIDVYFNGDEKAFDKYLAGSRNWHSKNKITNKTSLVVEVDGNYFTLNDGEIWELKKK